MQGSNWSRYVAVGVLLIALVGGGLIAKELLQSGAATIQPVRKPNTKEKAVFALINKQRTMRGLKALAYDPTMARLAIAHTASMIHYGYFDHNQPGGPTYAKRVGSVLSQGRWHRLEENIAEGGGGYGTAAGLVHAWMTSPEHKANILNPEVTKTGLGIATAKEFLGYPDTAVATQEFGG